MSQATHSYSAKDMRSALEHARDTMMALVRGQAVRDLDEQISWINLLLSTPLGPSDGTSVGPWKECLYKHPDAPSGGEVPSIRVDPAYLLKLEADAARYRWLRERPSFIGWDWWEPPVPGNVLITPEFMDTAIDEKLRQLATTLPLTNEKPCL